MRKDSITYKLSVEGLQEKMYFKHLQKLINSSPEASTRVNFDILNPGGKGPLKVAKDANKPDSLDKSQMKKDKRLYAIFDYDFKDDEFIEAVNYCNDNKISYGYSIVNFDLWLVNHKVYYCRSVNNNSSYVKMVKEQFSLKDSVDIKDETIIEKIVDNISLAEINYAINNAITMEQNNNNNLNYLPKTKNNIYNQPNLQIYEFVKRVMIKTGLYK